MNPFLAKSTTCVDSRPGGDLIFISLCLARVKEGTHGGAPQSHHQVVVERLHGHAADGQPDRVRRDCRSRRRWYLPGAHEGAWQCARSCRQQQRSKMQPKVSLVKASNLER